MLHPELNAPPARRALRARWEETRSLRIEPFLAEDAAARLLEALRQAPFRLVTTSPGSFAYQLWEHTYAPEPACEHVLCAFGRFLHEDGLALVREVTGLPLAPREDRAVTATLYTRGCYLDAHNDSDGARAVAYVVGLTPGRWPAERGGHLEFLEPAGGSVRVRERRAPGWNTLDLFSVVEDRPHRIPIVRDPVERRAISGWFYPG